MPTRPLGDSTTRVANTAFVQQEIADQAFDPSSLQSQIDDNRTDLDVIEGHFVSGILQVEHGGTGVTDSTGSGTRFVLQNSPTVYLGGGSTTPLRPLGDSTSRIASTEFVQQEIADQSFDPSGLQSQIDTNRTDLDVIEGHFVGGVLQVEHGGTGVTSSTGSGTKFVLQNAPSLTGDATGKTQSTSNSSTRLATTAFVHNLINEERAAFPMYAWQGSATIDTGMQLIGMPLTVYPSSDTSLFRISFVFDYYPSAGSSSSPWHKSKVVINGTTFSGDYAMTREWDGGRLAVEGQTKFVYWQASSTAAATIEVWGSTDTGSNTVNVFVIEAQEIVFA
jgi:hypothetical protein